MDATAIALSQNFVISEVAPSRRSPSLAEDVRSGLGGDVKRLHPKYFYDEYGSTLFDRICDTPEYYLTRTEYRLFTQYAGTIMQQCRPAHLLEFGSGTSRKTRLLLDAWKARGTYWPFDVSGEMLDAVGRELAREYRSLQVHALIGDYTVGLDAMPAMPGTTLAMFLGSSLGNFHRAAADQFLAEIAACLKVGDFFLLAVDLVKEPQVLEAAYNDAQGITAAFNKNILTVLNRDLDGDFDLDRFQHRAHYNQDERRMEMYLDATSNHAAYIGDLNMTVEFTAGESIWTEISCKYSTDELEGMLERADLSLVACYTDREFPYALALGRRLT